MLPNTPTGGTGTGATFNLYMAQFFEARSCKFDTCGAVVPGTTRMEECTFVNAVAEGARITSTSHRMKNNRYIGCDDGIEFTTAGTYTLDGDTFAGSVQADIHFSGAGALIVNLINGANASTSRVSGGGTVTINNAVSVDVHVDDNEGSPLLGARVLLEAADGTGPLP